VPHLLSALEARLGSNDGTSAAGGLLAATCADATCGQQVVGIKWAPAAFVPAPSQVCGFVATLVLLFGVMEACMILYIYCRACLKHVHERYMSLYQYKARSNEENELPDCLREGKLKLIDILKSVRVFFCILLYCTNCHVHPLHSSMSPLLDLLSQLNCSRRGRLIP
jgi:hypothetical protein